MFAWIELVELELLPGSKSWSKINFNDGDYLLLLQPLSFSLSLTNKLKDGSFNCWQLLALENKVPEARKRVELPNWRGFCLQSPCICISIDGDGSWQQK